MLNRVTLVGRITKDPEIRHTQSGVAVSTFTIAVSRPYTNQSGEKEADFIQCVVWRKQAENMSKYVTKGSLLGIDGRIQTRSYDAQDGSKRYITEIVCDNVTYLDTRNTSENDNDEYQYDDSYSQVEKEETVAQKSDKVDFSDDDLPF